MLYYIVDILAAELMKLRNSMESLQKEADKANKAINKSKKAKVIVHQGKLKKTKKTLFLYWQLRLPSDFILSLLLLIDETGVSHPPEGLQQW